MPRFPIKKGSIAENKVRISGNDHKHITKVLRFRVNDTIILFDDQSYEYTGKIISVTPKDLTVEIKNKSKSSNDPNIIINLFQAVPKGSKMDLIVQKASELGAKTITPIKTERSIVQESRKLPRWEKISSESCKQCGRSAPTEIMKFSELNKILKGLDQNDLNILFYENEKNSLNGFLRKSNKSYNVINIIIGPEGGFSDKEIEQALDHKINIIGLGPRILKVETASIAALSIIQHHFGDI